MAKVSMCAHDKCALQQLALNVHVNILTLTLRGKHIDLDLEGHIHFYSTALYVKQINL